jgi:pimeloyl-ACP methyl ester carboxylesterase
MRTSELPARLLDRMNVGVVRWRLSQDTERDTAGPPPPSGPPKELRAVRRERRGGVDAEHWVSGTSDWTATRLLAGGSGGPRGVLVFLHGWLATPLHIDYLAWRARPLVNAGIEVWLPRLPGHIERTPHGAVSGSRCLVPDVETSASMLRIAASETNTLGRWLRTRHDRVALWGISLGGWVAAVAVTRSVDWCGLVLWSPVVDPVATMRASPLAAVTGAPDADHGGEELVRGLRDLMPIEGRPASPELPALVLSGCYDDVAVAGSVRLLAKRWHAAIELSRHGHISMMLSRRAWRSARRFVIRTVGAA